MISRLSAIARHLILALVFTVQFQSPASIAQTISDEEFVVECYYKTRWGHFDEFYELYKKNHYPILKRLRDMGRIVRMEAAFPVNHAGESDRWDMRFTIVYPNVLIAHEDFDNTAIIEELYPDQQTLLREEKRRFELLEVHTDVPIWVNDLSQWPAK